VPIVLAVVAVLMTAVLAGGCDRFKGAAADDRIFDDPRDPPRGPGLLTGRSGEWKIIGK